MNRSITRALAMLLLAAALTQCRKQPVAGAVNLSLQELPLGSVQEATKGRWNLRRISGGLCGFCPHEAPQGSYMILSASAVTFGNDSLGVFEQGPISWAPATYFGNGYVFTSPSGNGYVPMEIRNDSLLLAQYAADGVTYHYTRN